MPATEYLDDRQLAEMLGLSRDTFKAWRFRGLGPPYLKLGRVVRYRRADVESWLAERRVLTNSLTSAES